MKTISIAKDFSEKPFGRYHIARDGHPADGKWTGERFREELLLKAFKDNDDEKVKVLLDGVKRGYGSSFLEEAFGGLVRAQVPVEKLKRLLIVESVDSDYIDEIWEYIDEAGE